MTSIPDPTPPKAILLVEDEEATLDLLCIILTKKYPDITLHTANNGRTGLDLFKSYMPAIIITDINMPRMDGVEMIEKIHSIKPDTKFIIITGRSEKSVLQDITGKGFEIDQHIVKPVVFQELFEAIEECLGLPDLPEPGVI